MSGSPVEGIVPALRVPVHLGGITKQVIGDYYSKADLIYSDLGTASVQRIGAAFSISKHRECVAVQIVSCRHTYNRSVAPGQSIVTASCVAIYTRCVAKQIIISVEATNEYIIAAK